MKKSLGNKRNQLADQHIAELLRLNAESTVVVDGNNESRICSKISANREFGFLKITIERPLRLKFRPARSALTD